MNRLIDFQYHGTNIANHTDKYFTYTRTIVEKFGDCQVTYAIFMRRPVLYAGYLAVKWLRNVSESKGTIIKVHTYFSEGDLVTENDVMLSIQGPFSSLVELETLFLQKLGVACVTAYNTFVMATELPQVAFLSMDARHCTGTEMAELVAYAVAVGSATAQRIGAIGFIASSNNATAHYFSQKTGWGSMPHAVIGYAGSATQAAQMFHKTFPKNDLVVLVDYYGREITESIAVAKRFSRLASTGHLAVRIDTHGGRFVEGLDMIRSYAILRRHAPGALRMYSSTIEYTYLVGPGVSAAAIWWLRESLDTAGFPMVRIIASSGFSPRKCKVIANARAPVDVIGTGSYLPRNWSETYATADIISYDSIVSVKLGREFLIEAINKKESNSFKTYS